VIEFRQYQRTSVNTIMGWWRQGVQSNLLVSPTGSGKTVMLCEVVRRARVGGVRVSWTCHRDSLVGQAKDELERHHPGEVACIHPDYPPDRRKPIQVATVQSLIARGGVPKAELAIFDEAHHYVADQWSLVGDAYRKRGARILGATATPERSDGKPLGGMFDRMHVAADYSELIDDGYLTDADLWAPPADRKGLALSPVAAYQRHGEGKQGFVFVGSVKYAKEVTKEFNEAGIPAAVIVANTPTLKRQQIVQRMKSGDLRLIVNVYTMTEGVNIPCAKVCILARGCGSVATYVQMVGRVLRPYKGMRAIVIDLSAVSLKHGFPTEDRVYTLHGEHGVARSEKAESLRQCLSCGFVWNPAGKRACPNCGWTMPDKNPAPRIYNADLARVYRGDDTPDEYKEIELVRLKERARVRGYSIGWVVREYRQLFKTTTLLTEHFTEIERVTYYAELKAAAQKKGYKMGWATGLYRRTFGCMPPRGQ